MNESITYHREGNYLIPNLLPPEAPRIGVWGMRRQNYLLKNKKPIYTGLLLSGKLNAHLEEVDKAAEEMFYKTVNQLAASEGVTERLKAQDQMLWVQRMNSIWNRAAEAVINEYILEP